MTNEELSAKVAEARGDECPWAVVAPHGKICCLDIENCVACSGSDCKEDWPKPYATDMNAAWELVKEMDHRFEVGQFHDKRFYFDLIGVDILEISSTAPRAICKAYLKFKGVE